MCALFSTIPFIKIRIVKQLISKAWLVIRKYKIWRNKKPKHHLFFFSFDSYQQQQTYAKPVQTHILSFLRFTRIFTLGPVSWLSMVSLTTCPIFHSALRMLWWGSQYSPSWNEAATPKPQPPRKKSVLMPAASLPSILFPQLEKTPASLYPFWVNSSGRFISTEYWT